MAGRGGCLPSANFFFSQSVLSFSSFAVARRGESTPWKSMKELSQRENNGMCAERKGEGNNSWTIPSLLDREQMVERT